MDKIKNENYYGSPLNKFIDEKCSHEMDCINIDCVQVKVSKNRIRIIESKRGNERTPKSEIRVMRILNYLLSLVKSDWQIEFCILSGEYPYEKAEIYYLGAEEPYSIPQDQLIKWLNFEE